MKEQFDSDRAADIIKNLMLDRDAFSQWLGIEVVAISAEQVELKMVIRSDMTNGFQLTHGGILFSLCDSALAFAANSYGRQAVSIQTSISHLRPTKPGDEITAVAMLRERTKSLGRYSVVAYAGERKKVALFEGTVFFTGETW